MSIHYMNNHNHPFRSDCLLKLCLTTALMLFYCTSVVAQLHIIPQPVSVVEHKGQFVLKNSAVIAVTSENEIVANYFQHYLLTTYGLKLRVKLYKDVPANAAIRIYATNDSVKSAYNLQVSPKAIIVKGNGAGAFYGIQSLIQLINGNHGEKLVIPLCDIKDYPRFGWRGLSLDVSRHFFTVDEVKKYIDIMAHYKLDVLHWHLTDDEGWRIQIKQYPLLTEVGSKMAYYSKIGKFRKLDNLIDEGRDGFYTQDDIRSVVKYAQDRFIDILPEIEMPGHSAAAAFAYPELRCKDSTGLRPTTSMLDPSEYTFTFYEHVLGEVMQLFPNKYIHIGGDEAEMTDWLKSPTAIALMKREHFTDLRQIQSYFIKRIERYLLANKKKLIGWDEILKGGLAPSATVMSWEGEEGGIIAAKMHHDVVMTPLPQMYFDAPQAKDENEPIGWNDPVTWQMVYNYEPQSIRLSPQEATYILGAQANIWTEKIGTYKHLEYMIYPRLLAEAELTWSPVADKDINRFEQAMYAHYRLFKLWGVNARIPDVYGLEGVLTNKSIYTQTLTYPLPGAAIRYNLNRKLPDTNATASAFPVAIKTPVVDSLIIKAYVTYPGQQRIIQSAALKHIDIAPPLSVNTATLNSGLNCLIYKTTLSNLPALDTGRNFINTVLTENGHIKPFVGLYNTWVKFNGYLKIDTEGDYKITSGFEISPIMFLGKVIILSNQNKYVEPQAVILHLQKGLYPLLGYYLADDTNSRQSLINLTTADGKSLNAAGFLFH
ncbi:beta-N-acetylhexosaminidase [Mucilaginibacter corticis]|uniref:beta-N-acetylhexosaminidase n=2 Tax=Mucilaginibacter corticis TaxID=2597670 RepID=A0A556MFV5_9SPHI|nr:beta-N-acetylhexosaminidase [Mucilaginibacter corticis]